MLLLLIINYLLLIQFVWFRLFNRSFNQSIRLRHIRYIQSSSTSFVDFNYCIYAFCTLVCLDQTVRLTQNFIVYHVLVILPNEVAIDTLIKTTSTAITREQSFCWNTVSCINCSISVFCVLSFPIGLKQISNSNEQK